jgi:hypothetical protein
VWDRLHADLLLLLRQQDNLDPDTVIVDGVIVRAFGGGKDAGPSPVDRRKPGTKYTLLVDRHGLGASDLGIFVAARPAAG